MKKRLTMLLFLLAALTALFATPATAADKVIGFGGSTTVEIAISGTYQYASAIEVVELINEERAKEGIAPLTIDYDLTELAMYRAAEASIYYSHTRPDGTNWATLMRANSRFAKGTMSENLAYGQTSAQAVVAAWMNSEGHRAAIMNPDFKSVGVGRIGNMWAQAFSTVSGTGTVASSSGVYHQTISIQAMISNLRFLVKDGCNLTMLTGETVSMPIYNANLCNGPTVEVTGDFYITSSDSSIMTTNGMTYTGISAGTAQLNLYWRGRCIATMDVTVQNRPVLTCDIRDYGYVHIKWDYRCDGDLYCLKEGDTMWTYLSSTRNATEYVFKLSRFAGKTCTFVIRDGSGANISEPIMVTFPSECDTSGHNWDAGQVTQNPTCTKEGVRTYTCTKCHTTKTESIAATGHSWNSGVITTAPTVTQTGVKTYTCRSCGKTKTETVAALGCPFTDLANPSTYYDAVLWAVDKGITTGATATEFKPKADCTRAQIVTFLWRYAGSPEPTSTRHNFTDIKKGASYYKAVLWAVEKGITTGVDETHFCPTEPCTRAQIVTFLWRYAGKPEPTSMRHSFKDIKSDGTYYKAVLWAVEKGITTGISTTEFWPKTTCTRAQSMTFLYRYHNS